MRDTVQSTMSVWGAFVEQLETLILATGDVVGGTGIGIVATTFIARAALIPITLPAARRSQAHAKVARSIRPQVKQVHRDYADDPRGLTRELKAVHSAHGIRMVDWSGVVGALVQLPVLIAFFQAILSLSESTPLASGGLLPGLVASGVAALGTVLSGQSKDAPWLLPMSAFLPVAISVWLGSGIALYLAAFYGATLIQSALMRRRADAATTAG